MKKKHLALKVIAVILAFCIVLSSVSCALVYFDVVNIPFIENILEKAGLKKEEEDLPFTNLEGKFTDIKITDEASALKAVASVSDIVGIENVDKELKVQSVNTVDGDSYYRMQQYYNDIHVYGRDVIVAADKDGNAVGLNSNALKNLDNLKSKPKVTEEKVNASVQEYLKNDTLKVKSLNNEDLVYYEHDGNIVLSYKLNSVIPGNLIFVDALNGKVIDCAATIYQNSAEARYNDKTFNAFVMDDGQYLMSNADKNYFVFNADGRHAVKADYNLKSYVGVKDAAEPMLSSDNIFGNAGDKFASEEYGKAITVMEFIDKISDFYKNLNEEQDTSTLFTLNNGFQADNAFGGYNSYNGISSYDLPYDKDKIISITLGKDYSEDLNDSIDVIGHEFTHGITSSQLDWNYDMSGESGALSEAYSDIFGELIEAKLKSKGSYKPVPDWINFDRIISNPEQNDYPSKANSKDIIDVKIDDVIGIKKGINVKTNLGVDTKTDYAHGYSTVISHAAYLMWNGINGNEQMKIDSDILAKIWYRSLLLMNSSPDFGQCAYAVTKAAEQMKNSGVITAEQVECVKTAFREVGIESSPYIYKRTVKNNFYLSVLSKKGTENVSYKLIVYRYNDVNKFTELFKGKWEKISEESYTSGNQHLSLDDGLYSLELTDLGGTSNTEKIRLIVDGTGDNAEDKVTVYTDFEDVTTLVLNEGESSENNSDMKKVLSPKSAVEIYLANKDVWMKNLDYIPMGGYDYGFLDLDFDGVLELVSNVNDGSERNSTNTYYKINLIDNSVKEVQSDEDEFEFSADYSLNEDYPKLLKNKKDNSYVYLCMDYLRINDGEYGESDGTISFYNDKVVSKKLFSEYHCEAGYGQNEFAVDKYNIITNGKYVEASKSEYENKYNEFMNNYVDMNLSYKFIFGKELETADFDKQRELLLDSYSSYSYDEFSFNDIETYDIEIKDTSVNIGKYYYNSKANTLDEYVPKLILKNDGSFVFSENLYEDMGTYQGTYRVSGNRLLLSVSTVSFSGFAGADAKTIEFAIINQNTLKLDNDLCFSRKDDVFSSAK